MIVALNSAYLAKEGRPLWKRELVAIGLTIVVGAMLIAALFLLLLGARFGSWLAAPAGNAFSVGRGVALHPLVGGRGIYILFD
jgi:uncharacterized BrkB/YihY/UPF0761 family membrane protein